MPLPLAFHRRSAYKASCHALSAAYSWARFDDDYAREDASITKCHDFRRSCAHIIATTIFDYAISQAREADLHAAPRAALAAMSTRRQSLPGIWHAISWASAAVSVMAATAYDFAPCHASMPIISLRRILDISRHIAMPASTIDAFAGSTASCSCHCRLTFPAIDGLRRLLAYCA